MQKTIYLIRHGQSLANRDFIIQGHYDAELTDLGHKQAKLTAEHFASNDFEIKNMFCSDLKRAIQTITPIAETLNLTFEESKEIREAYFGKWEGKSSHDVSEQEPEAYSRWRLNKTWRPAWCESYQDLQSRGMNFIKKVFSLQGNSLIVSHGGLINSVIDYVCSKSLSECSSQTLDNCGITVLQSEDSLSENLVISVVSINTLATDVPKTSFSLAS